MNGDSKNGEKNERFFLEILNFDHNRFMNFSKKTDENQA